MERRGQDISTLKSSISGFVFQVMRRQECPVNLSSTFAASSIISSNFMFLPADPFFLLLFLLPDDFVEWVGDLTEDFIDDSNELLSANSAACLAAAETASSSILRLKI